MLEWLANIDKVLFFFINVHLANPVTDWTMPYITSNRLLPALYAIAIILLLWKGDRKLRWAVIFSGITLVFTDQLVSHFLKEFFARPRPCQALASVHLLVNCGAGLSMPSSHAANAFGQAAFFSLQARRATMWLFIVAFLIAISRVFVGVHYPFDVTVGAMIGVVVGVPFSRLADMSLERLRRIPLQP